jgi:hypothetical protein
MKALLTACAAIACAATQVTWLEDPLFDRAAIRGTAAARPDEASSRRAGAREGSERGASTLVAPAVPATAKTFSRGSSS